jgi:hypothetical protein
MADHRIFERLFQTVNRQKVEAERKAEAEKQARARRALDTQIRDDALQLVPAWNERAI